VKANMTAKTATPYISKSKFIWGLQCAKLIWHAYHAKDLIPPPDAQTQAIFDQGHQVGDLAKKLFPEGIEVGQGIDDLDEVLRLSQQAVKARKPLFEAAFSYQGGFAKADILNPVAGGAWDIIEVKSSTSVKDVYIFDMAFQAFVYAGAGLKIRRCFLLLINPDFVRHGDVDPVKFFQRHDVTAEVSAVSRQIEPSLEAMFATIRLKDQPTVQIGPHCDDPYSCPLHDLCWSFLPKENVLELYRGTKKGFQLLADGINQLKDIPDGFPLTENQVIQRRVAVTGQPHISKPAIRAFLSQIKYPASFLDFETFATAIPLFDNTSPFEQVPFQFSLHVIRSPDSQPEHRMFLADGRADPRLEFLQRLRDWLPEIGSIIIYNQQFEQSRLQECCQLHPKFKSWLAGVENRFVDLLKPFRAFRYYGAGQSGSASMKAVLPTLAGRDYSHLAIQEGATASLEFLRVNYGDVPEDERQQVRRALEEYCGLDTKGMVWILDELRRLVAE
jgi:hypothetical protein